MRAPRFADWPAYVALAVILVGGVALRVMSLRHGLPWTYHADEAFHFVTRAMNMLEGSTLNPGYFENPTAYTYLVYAALRVTDGAGFLWRDVDGLVAAFAADPTSAFVTGRIVTVTLCMLGVVGVFAVGRRLWGPAEGVAAAAVLAFAFLPVAYSRFALTDTGVLLPVAAAIYGAVRAHEDGRLRWFALAGIAVGLAVAFKYTAGLVGVPLLVAAALRARRDRFALAGFALATGLGAVVFFVTNPYFFFDVRDALTQLREQNVAANAPKLGQGDRSGPSYYLDSLTWGLGWGAAIAAAVGVAWEWRRNRTRALLLALFPVVLFLYLCTAGRFFARWMMPAYPVLALLAGVAVAGLAARVPGRPWLRAAVLALLLAAVMAQPIAADLRTGNLLNRDDTRVLARQFLFDTLPHRARIVVEPSAPRGFFHGRVVRGFKAPPTELVAGGTPQRFILMLEPSLIEKYRQAGYCTVITFSAVRGRAEMDRVPLALAYYRKLMRESTLVFAADPYEEGAKAPPFDFDQSTHLYYPGVFHRPGPEVRVYRLDACEQGVGGAPVRVPPPRRALRPELR
ncbi:MAG TPA: glycosyltransferase family 39 protein, partial [Solirubrobacteraceae bacterium]|nr:glycosyltransferase family 39 protein [Solirubrobacteraceae bacterium]